jgi:hypothetical protein
MRNRRSPHDHHGVAAALKTRIETLEAELAKLEGVSAGHRADFERDRCERLIAEVPEIGSAVRWCSNRSAAGPTRV